MTIHVEQCNYKQKQVLKTFKHILSHKVCEMMSIGPIWVHHCRWKCPNCSSNNWVDDIVCSVHQITISELCSNSAAHCQTDAMSDWNCRLFFVPEFLSAMKKTEFKTTECNICAKHKFFVHSAWLIPLFQSPGCYMETGKFRSRTKSFDRWRCKQVHYTQTLRLSLSFTSPIIIIIITIDIFKVA